MPKESYSLSNSWGMSSRLAPFPMTTQVLLIGELSVQLQELFCELLLFVELGEGGLCDLALCFAYLKLFPFVLLSPPLHQGDFRGVHVAVIRRLPVLVEHILFAGEDFTYPHLPYLLCRERQGLFHVVDNPHCDE